MQVPQRLYENARLTVPQPVVVAEEPRPAETLGQGVDNLAVDLGMSAADNQR